MAFVGGWKAQGPDSDHLWGCSTQDLQQVHRTHSGWAQDGQGTRLASAPIRSSAVSCKKRTVLQLINLSQETVQPVEKVLNKLIRKEDDTAFSFLRSSTNWQE
jgi:hypothetical protein